MSQDPNNNIVKDGTLDGINFPAQMPLNSRSDPLLIAEKEGENENDSFFGGLPDEMIGHIFSFLPLKDRLRARLNKRMHSIEAQSAYHVRKMLIEEVSEKPTVESIDDEEEELPEYDTIGYDERITFFKERSYPAECVRKIGLNTTIDSLEVKLTGSDDFHREVFEFITDFTIEDLYLLSEGNNSDELMTDCLLTDMSRVCKCLHMDNAEHISAEAVQQVYENMKDGSAKLRTFTLNEIGREECFTFLKSIGIHLVDGRYTTGPNTVFFMKFDEEGIPKCPSFFVGSLEVTFSDNFHVSGRVDLMIDYHETRDSLDMALFCKLGMGFLHIDLEE